MALCLVRWRRSRTPRCSARVHRSGVHGGCTRPATASHRRLPCEPTDDSSICGHADANMAGEAAGAGVVPMMRLLLPGLAQHMHATAQPGAAAHHAAVAAANAAAMQANAAAAPLQGGGAAAAAPLTVNQMGELELARQRAERAAAGRRLGSVKPEPPADVDSDTADPDLSALTPEEQEQLLATGDVKDVRRLKRCAADVGVEQYLVEHLVVPSLCLVLCSRSNSCSPCCGAVWCRP